MMLILSNISSEKRTFCETKHVSKLRAHLKFSSCRLFKCHVLQNAICSYVVCSWHTLISRMFLQYRASYRCSLSFCYITHHSTQCPFLHVMKNRYLSYGFHIAMSFVGSTIYLHILYDFIYLHYLHFLKTEIIMVVHFNLAFINLTKCSVQT